MTVDLWLQDPTFLTSVILASAMLAIFGYFWKNREPPKLLPLDDFVPVPLIRKEVLSHDTRRFTFGLPKGHVLGLGTGQHLMLKYFDNADGGKAVQRSYTPVTDNTAIGYFNLVIKVYPPLPPKFPRGGLMSQHLDDLRLGEIVMVKGPKGHMHWKERGHFQVKPLGKPLENRQAKQFVLIAGGTGITPMLQILHAIFEHPTTSKLNKHLRCKLLYANQTPDDILVRDELQHLANKYPDRFQLWYTVDRVPPAQQQQQNSSCGNTNNNNSDEWKFSTGFINRDMIHQHAYFGSSTGATNKTQYFLCGPPPMIKFACLPALQELGCTEKDWVVF